MRYFQKMNFGILVLTLTFFQTTTSQESKFEDIPLNNLGEFKDAGKNWVVASEFSNDYSKAWNLKKLKSGTGVVLNNLTDKHHSHLVTKEEFGDVEVEVDFMMDKGSNSGVYLQGRYEVQLFDSWQNPNPTFSDCGGIYQRWDESRTVKGYEGMAPLANASRAPGLWQHLRIRFQAPRFDANGNKTANAHFEEVYLNGVLVQQQVEVTGPTRASIFDNEKALGPLVFQGDHGKVAFRNIRYRPLGTETDAKGNGRIGAIVIKPDDKPYLLRSFMMFEDKKLDYIISMGAPDGLNYSYDLRQGAWLQVWRGGFMDATDMWHSRGEAQLARPLGSVVPFSDSPTVARLSDSNMAWPDSLAFDDLQNDGYLLDKKGVPTFKYTVNGIKVSDKISPSSDGFGLNRTLTTENSSSNLYFRVISATKIELVDKGLYRVDGIYYIRMDKNIEPLIRTNDHGREMLVSLKNPHSTLTYSVIW
ncbi:3-keto-disaccharide hydrolase [Maribacter arcticus]|uniref:3-keto-alpha-glucoside-1,2-lyase/3-keto-2-hydroxy-glucal hydratase domain-containing protein n=1 Tax=Maribacter arcticus TaxID=561365 RepID=A0A1T5CJD6_9FLAO|nr:DUF1080 domain-containing protein [Maribacter arcticus]SKB59456.1 protein of unknown function [Maribacter arcticus]